MVCSSRLLLLRFASARVQKPWTSFLQNSATPAETGGVRRDYVTSLGRKEALAVPLLEQVHPVLEFNSTVRRQPYRSVAGVVERRSPRALGFGEEDVLGPRPRRRHGRGRRLNFSDHASKLAQCQAIRLGAGTAC